ncbi:MAG: copper chaperone PCu(A)C [Burkholderiaceae bacterium]|nr:copper chaperone PCu(A)C [Burkholderiaceae bacterium]
MNSSSPTVSAFAVARRTLVAATVLAATGLALAQTPSSAERVQVQGAWARASVPGQSGTGAFMRLTAREPLRLVGASSPAAGVVEVHEMKMEGDVMRMRALPELALPAGQAVELRPGGYHVMLMDLKAPLASGSAVPVTLRLKDARGTEFQLPLSLPVALAAPGAAPAADAHQGHHKH